jgi:uncharacterized protein
MLAKGPTVRIELSAKYDNLTALLADAGGVLVAFSGGVDSTFLLRAAVDALGERALAVTVASAIHPPFEVEEAECLARELGARHRLLHADPLAVEAIATNPPDRCYHCKQQLFSQLLELARQEGLSIVADGTNADDAADYRPGQRALSELGVRSPLREVGFTKAEIREASRALGLPTHDKPAYACLATRVPYGERLTPERLHRIAAAEQLLRDLGVQQVRVRDHGDTARIEVNPDDWQLLLQPPHRGRLTEALRQLGYRYVTLDLDGYRTGSMNVGVAGARDDALSGP